MDLPGQGISRCYERKVEDNTIVARFSTTKGIGGRKRIGKKASFRYPNYRLLHLSGTHLSSA